MPNISHDILRDVAFRIFRATGLPEEDARIISDHQVDSNLCGHDSHGVWLLPRYVGSMKDGYVGWDAHEVVRENATLAIIDGHGANGIVAMTKVVGLAVEKARAATFGAVTLRDNLLVLSVRLFRGNGVPRADFGTPGNPKGGQKSLFSI